MTLDCRERPTITTVEAMTPAWNRAYEMLFAPFRIGNWFALGFVAFVSMLGQGGGTSFNFNFNRDSGKDFPLPGTGSMEELSQILDKIKEHLPVLVMIFIGSMILGFLILAGLQYLGSRGTFMYIDNIVRKRAEVPWKRSKRHAWSFFCWKMALVSVTAGLGILILAAFILIGYGYLFGDQATDSGRIGIVVAFIAIIVPLAIASSLVSMFLHDMIAPIMYCLDINGTEAWKVFYIVLRNNIGQIAVYTILKVCIGFATLVAGIALACVTCCIAALPVIGQTVLQPLLLFNRAFPMFVLAQLGGPFSVIVTGPYEEPVGAGDQI